MMAFVSACDRKQKVCPSPCSPFCEALIRVIPVLGAYCMVSFQPFFSEPQLGVLFYSFELSKMLVPARWTPSTQVLPSAPAYYPIVQNPPSGA